MKDEQETPKVDAKINDLRSSCLFAKYYFSTEESRIEDYHHDLRETKLGYQVAISKAAKALSSVERRKGDLLKGGGVHDPADYVDCLKEADDIQVSIDFLHKAYKENFNEDFQMVG